MNNLISFSIFCFYLDLRITIMKQKSTVGKGKKINKKKNSKDIIKEIVLINIDRKNACFRWKVLRYFKSIVNDVPSFYIHSEVLYGYERKEYC